MSTGKGSLGESDTPVKKNQSPALSAVNAYFGNLKKTMPPGFTVNTIPRHLK